MRFFTRKKDNETSSVFLQQLEEKQKRDNELINELKASIKNIEQTKPEVKVNYTDNDEILRHMSVNTKDIENILTEIGRVYSALSKMQLFVESTQNNMNKTRDELTETMHKITAAMKVQTKKMEEIYIHCAHKIPDSMNSAGDALVSSMTEQNKLSALSVIDEIVKRFENITSLLHHQSIGLTNVYKDLCEKIEKKIKA